MYRYMHITNSSTVQYFKAMCPVHACFEAIHPAGFDEADHYLSLVMNQASLFQSKLASQF